MVISGQKSLFHFRVFYDRMKGFLLIFSTTVLSSVFLHHIISMSRKIDYGFNMRLNIAIGTITSLGWIVWYFLSKSLRPNNHRTTIVWFILWTTCAVGLEIFDFLPFFWTFDAHSLWHLATVFTTPIFYKLVSILFKSVFLK